MKGGVDMELLLAITPVVIIGGMVVYVIKKLQQQYNQGSHAKRKSKGAQDLIDSLMPIGMLCGCAVGVLVGMFSPIPLVYTVALGAGVGYFLGFLAYESYSKKGNDPS